MRLPDNMFRKVRLLRSYQSKAYYSAVSPYRPAGWILSGDYTRLPTYKVRQMSYAELQRILSSPIHVASKKGKYVDGRKE